METKLRKNTGTAHHDKHHDLAVPSTQSNDGNSRLSEITLEEDKKVHHKEKNEPKERKSKMNKKVALTLNTIALSTLLTLGLSSTVSVQAAQLKTKNLLAVDSKGIQLKVEDINLNGLDLNKTILASLKNSVLKSVEPSLYKVGIKTLKLEQVKVYDLGLYNLPIDNVKLAKQYVQKVIE